MKRLFANRWFRRFALYPLAVLLVLAVAGLITGLVIRANGAAKRDKLAAALDASDPGWRTVQLTEARNATLPPPERNAAELAERAYRQIPASFKEWMKRPEAEAWRASLKGPALPLPVEFAELRVVLAEAKDAVGAARALRTVPGGGFPLTFKEPDLIDTLLQQTQNTREVAFLLSQDALLRAFDRDADGALDSALAILAVARGIGDEPTLISQLVRIACSAIAIRSVEQTLAWTDTASDAKLAEVRAALLTEADVPRLKYGLRGERAMWFRLFENIGEGRSGSGNPLAGQFGLSMNVFVAVTMPDQQATCLEVFTTLLAAADLPPGRARTAALDAEVRRLLSLPQWSSLFLQNLLPAFNRVDEADARIVGWLRAAATAIECERERLKTGKYPAALTAPAEDPFTGKPLLFAAFDDGIAVYSTGIDGKDDGGTNLDATKKEKADVGVRLFLPKHRRQPPPE